jgi:hypothetical protein
LERSLAEEDARMGQQGYLPEQQSGDISDVYPSAPILRSGEEPAKAIRNLDLLPIQVNHSGVLGPYFCVVHSMVRMVPMRFLFERELLSAD